MSMEECQLCKEDSTPWHFIKGHICQDCYYNAKEKKKMIDIVNWPQAFTHVGIAFCFALVLCFLIYRGM